MLNRKTRPSNTFIQPKARSSGRITGQCPKGAPHLDAAYAWLNYTMQGDIFWMMLRDFPYTNPNKAALEYARVNQPELYKTFTESIITNPPPDVIANTFVIEDVGDALPLYDQIWTEVKGGE